ncbi:MAG: FUSC family protein [Gammaproteobacteria bacterium]|nr:FUSC family protein [Gammaproteobacteria bacterium]
MTPTRPARAAFLLHRRAGRAIFRQHVENGLSVTFALGVVALGSGVMLGTRAAVIAAIGAMCVSLVDQPAPLPTKLRMLLAALAGSTCVTLCAGLASRTPWLMAAVIAATSLGLALATAFGRPALTLGIAGVLALVIGLALPAAAPGAALARTELFAAGGAAYAAIAMALAAATLGRARRTALNEAMLAFAAFLRNRASLYEDADGAPPALDAVIESHGVMMEHLQSARELIFRGARDRRWVGAMIALIDAYEAALASDADWESLRATVPAACLAPIAALTRRMADDVERMALSLVSPLATPPNTDHAALLAALEREMRADPSHGSALRATCVKLTRALQRTVLLANAVSSGRRPVRVPSGVDVGAFLLPSARIGATLRAHLRLNSPVMRYAVRLTLAMLVGYAVTRALPRYVHGGWVLLTVALIMRSSYAVTRQRRNDRLLGTLTGCAFAAILIPLLPASGIVLTIIIAAGVAHAHANVNYRITSFSASVMALMLLHFLEPASGFVAERIIDTGIGVAISVVFARVLPSWEWRDVPRLAVRLIAADRLFADEALAWQPDEQRYRLARKSALDAFTALATTTRRLASEPKRHAGDLAALNQLLAANYLFASDLASVQGLLRAQRERISADEARALLAAARASLVAALDPAAPEPSRVPLAATSTAGEDEAAPAPPEPSPMEALRRRLGHAAQSASRLAAAARRADPPRGYAPG